LSFQVIPSGEGPRKKHEPARIPIDPMDDVRLCAGRVTVMICEQIHQRRLLASPARQRLDNQACGFVDDNDSGVLVNDLERVTETANGQVGRLRRTRSIHPDSDPIAWSDRTVGGRRVNGVAVDEHLAFRKPFGCPPPGRRVGAKRQPLIEPHSRVRAVDDPVPHAFTPRGRLRDSGALRFDSASSSGDGVQSTRG